ncbi:MAG: hypothetical protein GYA14_14645, partial [Ignavibacteria bacterium]|nr:hypothetical protein [Ignavibacteria bacterium]
MKKRLTIPTILGMIFLVVGVFAGVLLLRNVQMFRIGASGEATHKDIRISNITDNSVSISWTTDKASSGFINWGTSQGGIDKIVQEDVNGQKYFSHLISLSGLEAKTKYYFKISSNGTLYDNVGIPWQFTTGDKIGTSNKSILLSGNVISATGTPESKALVYVTIGGYTLSTLTSDTGNFVFQLGSARSQDLNNFASIDMSNTLIQI